MNEATANDVLNASSGLPASESPSANLEVKTQLAILDALPAHIALIDEHGVILSVNLAWRDFARTNGFQSERYGVGQNYLGVCDEAAGPCSEDATQVAEGIRRVVKGEISKFALEYPCHPINDLRWFECMVTPLEPGRPGRAVIAHSNITERKLAELNLARLNRLYAVLSQVNGVIVRTKDETRLLSEVCRIAVAEGLFRMAAVVTVDKTTGRALPLTHAGHEDGYFSVISVNVHERELQRGTIGTAIRTGSYDVCNDFADDPRMAPWREEALKRDYRSTASFPLIVEGGVYGALVLFAGEPNYFSADKIQLLCSVAENISFAVEALKQDDRRRLAEISLRHTTDLLSAVAESTGDAVFVKDIEGRYQLFNRGAASLVGREVDEVLGQDDNAIFGPEDARVVMENDRLVIESGRTLVREEVLTAVGVTRTYLASKAPYFDSDGKIIGMVGISRDITDRKRQEQHLAMLSGLGQKLNSAASPAEAGRIITDAAEQMFGWDAATLDLYSPDSNLITTVITVDTIQDRKVDCAPAYDREPPSPLAQRVLQEGAQLILRNESTPPDPAQKRFGDTARSSASLMLVPIRDGTHSVGILSIQSYRQNAYTADDLNLLQLLADYCGGALNRIQTEAMRHASEERFRLLARATNDAIWDWDLATQTLWWNEGIEVLFGYDRAEIEPTIDSWFDRIHPADREATVAAVLHTIDHGLDGWTGEHRFMRRDGTHAYVLNRGHIIRDSSGKGVRMVGGMTDLSERKQAEDKIREQATLLDKAQDAIVVRDLDHRILFWNHSAERLYGWTAAEAVGRSIRELLYQNPDAFLTATSQALEKGEWVGEIQQFNRDGRELTIEARWTLVRDDNGQPHSILAINTDVTERKQLEQQFLRAQRMESIGTLAGGIAHDLNNVLAPILMSIEVLRLREQDPGRLNILATIEGSARRGADLVRQVLSFARGVEGRKVELRVEHLLREVEKIANDTFLKSIRVLCSIPSDLWTLAGDPTQLHQVLLNLCVNARDAMPQGGTLSLSARNAELDGSYAGMHIGAKPGPHVVIEVEDNGSGMPPEVVERIFEPFFTTKEFGKGTGLGLSTTMAIVKSHGGFVRVESVIEVGTKFLVHLPALAEVGRIVEQPEENDLPRGEGELILVVDDEDAVRQITRQTLETFGYRVLLATDGAEAVKLYAAKGNDIAAVLTDMMMPVMDGPTMIHVLLRVNPDVRILAASGINTEVMVSKAAQAGVSHFMPKPYTAVALLNQLKKLLHPAA